MATISFLENGNTFTLTLYEFDVRKSYELGTLRRQYLYMGLMAASAELASIQHLRRVIWQLPTQIANDF